MWKSLSRVQLFVTPWTIHSPWNSPGQNTGVGSLSLLQGLNPCLSHWAQGKPKNTKVCSLSLLQWIFPTQESNQGLKVSCIAAGFFTSWGTKESQEYWSGQPIPSLVDLPDPGIKPWSPALQVDSLPVELSGKPRGQESRHKWTVSLALGPLTRLQSRC